MFLHPRSGYLPLASPQPSSRNKSRRWGPNRTLRLLPCLTILAMIVLWFLWTPALRFFDFPEARLPPLYQEYRDREDSLLHYDLDAPFPNGPHAKYILIDNHQRCVGWGNVMQELLFNALLAYTLRRSFVFYNYEWRSNAKYSIYNNHLIPSTIPLSAILSGPLVGGVIEPRDVPRAISLNHFRQVCPKPTIISGDDLIEHLQGGSAMQIFSNVTQKLGLMNDRCIEIPRETRQIWSYFVFGSKDVLEIWPALLESPIITHLDWSPLIHSAFDSNRMLFESSSFFLPLSGLTTGLATTPPYIPNLLAIHLRRGDFSYHCDELAKWSSGFNGFNSFDELPDKFQIPPGGRWGENTPENYEIYHRHCYPSIPQIVEKVHDVKQKVPGLERLYIMTNGDNAWINELKSALQEGPGEWKSISSSRDLILTWEQKFVVHALDMYVAQRAHAFVGNGWSSLTSNSVLLRMAGKHNPNTTFFW